MKFIRKANRLKDFDYNSSGAYFITICTKDRKNIFWKNEMIYSLSHNGVVAERIINQIPKIYPNIFLDKYVIMPDHIHLILRIGCDENGRPMVAPTISRVINQMKGSITKHIGFSLWQKSFYEHIIRNVNDYKEIYTYIENNPYNWINERRTK